MKKLSKYLVDRILRIIRFHSNYLSMIIRSALYKKLLGGTSINFKVKSGVIIDSYSSIKVGCNISVQDFAFISAYGGLNIGDNVSIAPYVKIFTTHHPYNYGVIKENPLLKKPVFIGNNVWIGSGAIILGGTVIGDNIVIGAGSVVSGKLESNSVYAGNPCKKIKNIDGTTYEG